MNSFEHDIFLSYNRVDKAWVRRLASRIEGEEWQGRRLKVFFDEWDIQPGENVPIALEKALGASRKIGFVISPEAVESAWVEMERAIAVAFDPSGRHGRFIPLLLRGADHDLPPLVLPLRYIDFRDANYFEERLRELICAIREEPLPRMTRTPDVTTPVALRNEFKARFLADANHQCSICHTTYSVDLYPITQTETHTKLAYNDLIALCPSCYLRAVQDGVTPAQLRSIKRAWLSLCKTNESALNVSERIEETYSAALRLSLSQDIWDVKRARIMCQEILHYYNPFHADTQILMEKLLRIEKILEAELAKDNFKLHAPIHEGEPGWLTLMLLPATIFEELGHAFTYWLFGVVKNARGKRMPLLRCFTYVQINDLPLKKGIVDAIKHRRVRNACVNLSKMQRDWFTEIDF
jgi:hypothetical protein